MQIKYKYTSHLEKGLTRPQGNAKRICQQFFPLSPCSIYLYLLFK